MPCLNSHLCFVTVDKDAREMAEKDILDKKGCRFIIPEIIEMSDDGCEDIQCSAEIDRIFGISTFDCFDMKKIEGGLQAAVGKKGKQLLKSWNGQYFAMRFNKKNSGGLSKGWARREIVLEFFNVSEMDNRSVLAVAKNEAEKQSIASINGDTAFAVGHRSFICEEQVFFNGKVARSAS